MPRRRTAILVGPAGTRGRFRTELPLGQKPIEGIPQPLDRFRAYSRQKICARVRVHGGVQSIIRYMLRLALWAFVCHPEPQVPTTEGTRAPSALYRIREWGLPLLAMARWSSEVLPGCTPSTPSPRPKSTASHLDSRQI